MNSQCATSWRLHTAPMPPPEGQGWRRHTHPGAMQHHGIEERKEVPHDDCTASRDKVSVKKDYTETGLSAPSYRPRAARKRPDLGPGWGVGGKCHQQAAQIGTECGMQVA